MFTKASIRPCFFPGVKSTLPTTSSFWLLSLTLGGGEDSVCQLALLERKSGMGTIAHLKPVSPGCFSLGIFVCSFHKLSSFWNFIWVSQRVIIWEKNLSGKWSFIQNIMCYLGKRGQQLRVIWLKKLCVCVCVGGVDGCDLNNWTDSTWEAFKK